MMASMVAVTSIQTQTEAMMQRNQTHADRLAEIESAQFALSTRGGTPTTYGYAMRVIDRQLSGDSHTYWQQRYEHRLEELCRD